MTDPRDYRSCLQEMYGLHRFGIKLGLETIGRILAALGNPQLRPASIHIAGSNGKGSVASTLAAILLAAGQRVGLYTSPHLVSFNERIRIDGQPVTDAEIVAAYQAVKKAARGTRQPTFFEITTAMALDLFARRAVDWAVIETGMGGRLDATNIVVPELSVITNISMEHRAYLGGTIAQIAREKAGIIKKNVPVVTGVRQSSARAQIERIAEAMDAPSYRLGRDFHVRRARDGTFSYRGLDVRWRRLRTALAGSYQVDNAALVLAGCELLRRGGLQLPTGAILAGLAENRWPGRLEVVHPDPLIILDGAHNAAAARNLAGYLGSSLAGRPLTLVVGILDDKPWRVMLDALLPLSRNVVVTAPRIDRALPAKTLAAHARGRGARVQIVPVVAQAVKSAVAAAVPGEAVCVAGSLYVVGEAKEALPGILESLPADRAALARHAS